MAKKQPPEPTAVPAAVWDIIDAAGGRRESAEIVAAKLTAALAYFIAAAFVQHPKEFAETRESWLSMLDDVREVLASEDPAAALLAKIEEQREVYQRFDAMRASRN